MKSSSTKKDLKNRKNWGCNSTLLYWSSAYEFIKPAGFFFRSVKIIDFRVMKHKKRTIILEVK